MSNAEISGPVRIEYGYATVPVVPFQAEGTNGRPVMVESFFGWLEDEGRYLRGRGHLIRKDGSLGVREQDVVWSVPANVREALVAAIVEANAR